MIRPISAATLCPAFCLGALALSGSGLAQTMQSPDGRSGIYIKVGVFYPVRNSVRDVFNNTGLIGGEYEFLHMAPLSNGINQSLSFSVEAWGKNDFGAVPVTVNYNFETPNRFRFSGGIGLAADQAPFSDGTTDHKVRLAYGLSAAYLFSKSPNSFFVEAKFLGNGDTALSGFAFSLGYRF